MTDGTHGHSPERGTAEPTAANKPAGPPEEGPAADLPTTAQSPGTFAKKSLLITKEKTP